MESGEQALGHVAGRGKCFILAVRQFDEAENRGALLIRATQIPISYIIFSIYSFDII